jgi:RNA polymerase sigma-70 factor (ECF subfamily)
MPVAYARPSLRNGVAALTEASDNHLMTLVQQGNRQAFDELYRRWSKPLFSFLLKRTGRRTYAEEALQETFLRVHRFASKYDPERPFRSWVFRIAANAGRDAWFPERNLLTLEVPEAMHNPVDPIIARDLLVKGLFRLRPEDRNVLLLELEGFTPTEIAHMRSQKPVTVRSRLARARTRLRTQLEGVYV